MRVELTRFRVLPGKRDRVDEWMQFLERNMDAVRETLEPEQIYVETIFAEAVDGIDYLYWYSLQGEAGSTVEQSEHWLDAHHVRFWKECIDDQYPGEDLTARVTMMPERVETSMRPLSLP